MGPQAGTGLLGLIEHHHRTAPGGDAGFGTDADRFKVRSIVRGLLEGLGGKRGEFGWELELPDGGQLERISSSLDALAGAINHLDSLIGQERVERFGATTGLVTRVSELAQTLVSTAGSLENAQQQVVVDVAARLDSLKQEILSRVGVLDQAVKSVGGAHDGLGDAVSEVTARVRTIETDLNGLRDLTGQLKNAVQSLARPASGAAQASAGGPHSQAGSGKKSTA